MADDSVYLERIAIAFESIARVCDRFAEKYCKPPEPRKTAVITRVDDEKKKEFDDKANPEWFDETEQALPSRFQQRLEKDQADASPEKAVDGPQGSGSNAGTARTKPRRNRNNP